MTRLEQNWYIHRYHHFMTTEAKFGAREIIRQHRLYDLFEQGSLEVHPTDFSEIEEFLAVAYGIKIPQARASVLDLPVKKWAYLYAPGMESWLFIGGDQNVPTEISDATAYIATDTYLMSQQTGETRKGIQIAGFDNFQHRVLTASYDQHDRRLVRAAFSCAETEFSYDPTLLADVPPLLPYDYYAAGPITKAMLEKTPVHDKMINIRSIWGIDRSDPQTHILEGKNVGVPLNGNLQLAVSDTHYYIKQDRRIFASFPRQLPQAA